MTSRAPAARRRARPLAIVTTLALLGAAFAPACALAAGAAATPAASKPAAKTPLKTAPKTAAPKPVAQGERADAESADRSWARARALADDDRHGEALDVLHGALARHPDDTSLRWLEAGVTGWSGRHQESVELYERLIAQHPKMADDVRVDLATERLWAGDPAGAVRDLDEHLKAHPDAEAAARVRALALAHADREADAIEAYDTLLLEHPTDTELLLGRAQALAWSGKHDQASEAYRRVLDADPESMDAWMGVAQNQNWSGHHREAAALYADILKRPDADPEALKGLAYAEYWAGRHDRAYEPLDRFRTLRPDDPEGRELQVLLSREFNPGLTAGYDWMGDSDDLHTFTTTLEYRIASHHRGALALLWRRDHVKDGAGKREPYRLGAGYERIWTDLWSSRAYLYAFKPGSGRTARGMGEVSLTFHPTDRVTFDGGFAKEPVLTRLSLERDVDLRTGSVGLNWMARPRLRVEAASAWSRYSDENDAQRASVGVEFQLVGRRRFESFLTAGHEVLQVDHDPGNGYYAPSRYTETWPGLILRWHPRESATFEIEGRLGSQKESGADAEAFHHVTVTLDTPLGRSLSLHTMLETSDSNLATSTGFEQNRWAAYLSVPF